MSSDISSVSFEASGHLDGPTLKDSTRLYAKAHSSERRHVLQIFKGGGPVFQIGPEERQVFFDFIRQCERLFGNVTDKYNHVLRSMSECKDSCSEDLA